MRLLSWYVTRELVVPLFFACTLTIVLVSASQLVRMANEISGLGISIWDLISALPFAVPTFLGMGLPVAYLLAMLIGFGRMSEDRELIAMASAGVKTRSLLAIAVLIGLVLVLIGLCMTAYLEPIAIRALRGRLVRSATDYFGRTLEPSVIHDDLPGVMIYCSDRDEDSQVLKNVVIYDERDAKSPRLLLGKEGYIDRSIGSSVVLTLIHGELHIGDAKAPLFERVTFDRAEYRLDTGSFVHRTTRNLPTLPELSVHELAQLAEDKRLSAVDRRRYAIALHRKFAFPADNFIFVFIVFPLATLNTRAPRIFLYLGAGALASGFFVLAQATESLMDAFKLSAPVATWLPNVVFLAIGLGLTRLRLRRS